MNDCESCQWWDDIIKRAERRLADAPDPWARRTAEIERRRFVENRDEHARSHGVRR
ncbi:hypothetical protein ACSNOK_08540 [Streptomyces sp. URMC 126]|uniref:hypothetical protein n=1 Tax=Streptomyces sp. URMC 126 TaxID=3423401 RepID=UPI003F1A6B58